MKYKRSISIKYYVSIFWCCFGFVNIFILLFAKFLYSFSQIQGAVKVMYLCKPHFTFFFSFFFLPTGLLFRPRGQWQSRDIFSSPGRSPSQWHSFPGSFTRNKVSSNSNSMDCYFAADPLCKYKRKLRVYWDNGQCKDNLDVNQVLHLPLWFWEKISAMNYM